MSSASFQFLFLFLFLVPMVLFLITQQNTLKLILPQNRFMSPGEVWLQLIPLFGLVWQFFVVARISNSLRKELASQNNSFSFEQSSDQVLYSMERPTYNIGIAYCALMCCSLVPGIRMFFSLAGIICWIIYWIKLSDYKRNLTRLTI